MHMGTSKKNPLNAQHGAKHLTCCLRHRTRTFEWHRVLFKDNSCFGLWRNKGRRRVWLLHGEAMNQPILPSVKPALHQASWIGVVYQDNIRPKSLWQTPNNLIVFAILP
ncbi:hypothetical protein TNCV_3800511 [Trichonephila clavipes]|nr:hypothetical protein TNCV_3800511 [Trichonephila clavipes]